MHDVETSVTIFCTNCLDRKKFKVLIIATTRFKQVHHFFTYKIRPTCASMKIPIFPLSKFNDKRLPVLNRLCMGQRIYPVGKTWLIKKKVVPLQHGSYPIASSHPS